MGNRLSLKEMILKRYVRLRLSGLSARMRTEIGMRLAIVRVISNLVFVCDQCSVVQWCAPSVILGRCVCLLFQSFCSLAGRHHRYCFVQCHLLDSGTDESGFEVYLLQEDSLAERAEPEETCGALHRISFLAALVVYPCTNQLLLRPYNGRLLHYPRYGLARARVMRTLTTTHHCR